MTLLDFLRLTRANLLFLLAGVLLGAGLGYGYSYTQPAVYTATSSGYVTTPGAAGIGDIISGDAAAQSKASSYLPLVTSRSVAEKIAASSNTGLSADEIPGKLSASVDSNSTLIKVTARAGSGEDAAQLANSALQATTEYIKELDGGENAVQVVPLDDAQVPGSPSSPDRIRYLLIGAGIGLALSYAVAFLRRFADVRVRTTDDLETATGAGTLGILPKAKSLDDNDFLSDRADHQTEEALRQLRTNLRFVSVDSPPRSIIVTSPNPGEGKSTVSSSLAHAFAKSGRPTLLLDADLRRPTVAKIFGLDNSVGLTQVLSGQVTVDDAIQQIGDTDLFVIPAGRIPPNPSELLGSEKMQALINELREEFLVLVDVPPLLPVTDGSLLSTVVDGAILVTACGRTRKDATEAATDTIHRVKGQVLGTVLNFAPEKGVGSQYYGFGYGGYKQGYQAYYGEGSSRSKKSSGSRKKG